MKIKLDTADPETRRILNSAKRTAAQVAKWPPWKRGWSRIAVRCCDICDEPAIWEHASGGFRCEECPKP